MNDLIKITDEGLLSELSKAAGTLAPRGADLGTVPKAKWKRNLEGSPARVEDPEVLSELDRLNRLNPTSTQVAMHGFRSGAGIVEAIGDSIVNYIMGEVSDDYTDEDIRKDTIARRGPQGEDRITSGYQDIENLPDQQQRLAHGVGGFGAAIADPTSLLPLGRTFLKAVGIGAGIGGTHVAAQEMAEMGEVNISDVGQGMLYGAALGGGLYGVGKAWTSYLAAKKAVNAPTTGTEIARLANDPRKELVQVPKDAPLEGELLPREQPQLTQAPREGVTIDSTNQQGLLEGPQSVEGVNVGRPLVTSEANRLPSSKDAIEGEFTVLKEQADGVRTSLHDALNKGDYEGAAAIVNGALKLGVDHGVPKNIREATTNDDLWKIPGDAEVNALTRIYGNPAREAPPALPTKREGIVDTSFNGRLEDKWARELREERLKQEAEFDAKYMNPEKSPDGFSPDDNSFAARLSRKQDLEDRKLLEKLYAEHDKKLYDETEAILDKLHDHKALIQKVEALDDELGGHFNLGPEAIDMHLARNRLREFYKHVDDAHATDNATLQAQAFHRASSLAKTVDEAMTSYRKFLSLAHDYRSTLNKRSSTHRKIGKSIDKILGTEEEAMKKVTTLSKSHGKELGEIDQRLMFAMGRAGIGGTIGYVATGDPYGAVMGAAIGLGLPYGKGLFTRAIGKFGKSEIDAPAIVAKAEEDYSFAAMQGWYLRSPSYILRTKFGGLGRLFDDLMDKAQTKFERTSGDELWKINKPARDARASGMDKAVIEKAETDAMNHLKGSVKEADLSPLGKAMAKTMTSYFQDVLKRSLQAKIISPKEYARLAHIAANKLYFPRQYDMAFLSTRAGQEKWVEVMTAQAWKPEKLEATLKNILGDNEQTAALIREYTSKTTGKTSQIYITRDLARKMLENFRKNHKVSRSGHLEHSRKVHVEEESILDPFVVKDPRAAMAMYVADAEKRIAYALTFGANDEKAIAGIKYITDKFGERAGRFTGELYWQRLGDSRSEMIRRAGELSQIEREVIGRVSAFQTLKLTLAPLANMTQAPFNGMLATNHLSGGFKTSLRIMGSMLKDLKRDRAKFQETAERSGAVLETSLMQIIGEFSSVEHRIFGREFTGKLTSPLEILNHPTKFLKFVGFVGAERMQRVIGSNWGRSYAELLMDDLNKARAAGKSTKRIEAQMRELKLDPTKTVWSEAEVLDAALRWSDHVNFRNTPGTMPLGWAHPHATWFRKFKTYSFNQGNFIMEHVVKPVWKAETLGQKAAGGMTLATLAVVLGIPLATIRGVLMGDDKEYTMTEQLVRGLSTLGGFGIWYDITRSREPGTSFFGPVASDAVTIVKAGKKYVDDMGKKSPGERTVKLLSDIVFGTTTIPGEKIMKKSLTGGENSRNKSNQMIPIGL